MTHPDPPRARPVAHARDEARRGMPAIERALTDLAEVETLVALVALLRDPSTRRPWREVQLDAYARAELDHQARAEVEDRNAEAPGEHRDAARADVLDLLSGVLWRAQDLAAYVLRAVYHPALPAAGPAADPRPYLTAARTHLTAACLGWANGADFAYFAADRAAAMLDDLRGALALNVAGHVVKALCPWCHGGLAGEWTWRVRVLVDEPAIVCESGVCNPPSRDVGTWFRGAPAWRFRDWEWLAARLWHLDQRRTAAAPLMPYASFAGSTGRAGTVATPDAERELLAGVPLTTDPTEGTAA